MILTTFDEISNPVVGIDRTGCVVLANRALLELLASRAERATGGQPAVTLGARFATLFDAREAPLVARMVADRQPREGSSVRFDADLAGRRFAWTLTAQSSGGDVDGHLDALIVGTDVTALAEAERAVTDRLESLLAVALDGVFVADRENRYVNVNTAGCRMLGYQRDELIGRSVSDLIPPEDVERLAARRQRLAEGDLRPMRWRVRTKSGAYLPVEASSKLLADGRWQGFIRDLSERERRDWWHERLDSVLALTADALVVMDEEGTVVLFNDAAERLFGWPREEIVGRSHEVLLPERLRAMHGAHVRAFADARVVGRTMGVDAPCTVGLRRDGTEVAIEGTISKIATGGGWLLSIVARDSTERKRVEQGQRLLADLGSVLMSAEPSPARLVEEVPRILVRAVADLCAIDLVEDGALRRVTTVHGDPNTRELMEALGAAPGEPAQPLDFPERVLASRAPIFIPELTQEMISASARSPFHRDLVLGLAPRSLISVPLLARAQALGVLTLISSSRRYEERDLALAEQIATRLALAVDNARLYEAARRATHLREEVLAIVAHDLRNPLSGILMQLKMARRRDGPERRTQEPVAAIGDAARRMNRLIQDLLDVARLESGPLPVKLGVVAPAAVVAECAGMLGPDATSASVRLTTDVEPGLPSFVADHRRLAQALENLVGNALKFTRAGGHVVIGARRVEDEVVFSVIDDGTGIALEDQPHVFDRFWQATRGDRRGTGLGLAIVKSVAEVQGGRVWVESALGAGAAFYLALPLRTPPATTEQTD